jgi:thymidylate kinase
VKTDVTLATELCRFMESRGVRYAVVGDVSEFPERIRSDLDIVVDQGALEDMDRWLREFFEERGARLVQVLQHEQTAWFFVFAWENETGGFDFIHPDVCGDYYRDGRLLLTAEEVLAERMRATSERGDDLGFYVPAPAMAFVYYLLKRVDKADLAARQGAYLSEQWRRDPTGAESQVRRFWRQADAARIIEAATVGDWEPLQPVLPVLRGSLRARIGWRPSWWLGELGRIVRRVRRPTGVWVAFLGPDGSGKSTVIERVRADLNPAFRRTRVVHLRPFLGRRRSQSGPVTEPHAERARGTLSSALKLGYWLLDYTMGYLVQTRPALTRSNLILYDRYYPDLLVDPVRYRYGGSMRLVRRLASLVPQPDLYIVLDVPPAEIHKRKSELPMEEIDRQRGTYARLAREIPNAHLIDASTAPSRVGIEVDRVILDYMESRVGRQLARPRMLLTER